MTKTLLDYGDFALIFKVTVEQNMSNLSVCCVGPLLSLKTILVSILIKIRFTGLAQA